jgi:hypothetical protein
MKTPYDKDKYFLFLIIVGLGLTTAWSWGTFQEGHLFIQFPQLLSISPEHAFFFFPLFNAIFFTLMAKYTFFFNGNKFFKQLLLFSVFSLFLLLPRTPSHLSIWMDFASISIASAALALFDGGWMWLGTNLSPQKAVLVFSAANMLASLIMAVHPWFPPSFLLLITGAFPLVSALFWGKSFNFSFSSSEPPHLRPQTSFKGKWLAPLHFGLAIRIFLFFLACSIFHHHILSSSGTETISHFFFSELMYGAGALTAALLVYKIPKIKLRHIYILAQILIGTGFLLISPFYGFSGWISILPITLLQFGFGCFGAYAWATLVGLASRAPKEHALSVASKGLALIAGSVIMFSIPFALTGVAFAYLLTGMYLSLQALLGVIMLVGIVVNNAIVLVDYINLLRARGLKLRESLLEAGERRLRPVLMTTLTTFFGMLPMAISQDQGAELWRPLAISVMGGLLVSTIVTLVIVPVIYSLFEEKLRRKKRFAEAEEV